MYIPEKMHPFQLLDVDSIENIILLHFSQTNIFFFCNI